MLRLFLCVFLNRLFLCLRACSEGAQSQAEELVTIDWRELFDQLTDFFKEKPKVPFSKIEFILTDAGGKVVTSDRNGDLMLKILDEYWRIFYERCTIGRLAKVPELQPLKSMDDEFWKACAVVLAFGYERVEYFPTKISIIFWKHCFPDLLKEQGEKEMLQSYLRFVSEKASYLLKKILNSYKKEEHMNMVLDLEELGIPFRRIPTDKRDLELDLIHLAKMEFIQKPEHLAKLFHDVFQKMGLVPDLGKNLWITGSHGDCSAHCY